MQLSQAQKTLQHETGTILEEVKFRSDRERAVYTNGRYYYKLWIQDHVELVRTHYLQLTTFWPRYKSDPYVLDIRKINRCVLIKYEIIPGRPINQFDSNEVKPYVDLLTRQIKNHRRLIRSIGENLVLKALFNPSNNTVLCHGDYSLSNILYDSQTKKINVIDWDNLAYRTIEESDQLFQDKFIKCLPS